MRATARSISTGTTARCPRYAGSRASGANRRLAAAARDLLPLVAASVVEHDALLARTDAQPLVHDGGWIEAFRSPALFDAETRAQRVPTPADDRARRGCVAGARPGIGDAFCGAFHWQDPKTVSNPGGLTKAYARLFERDGGTFALGDARTLVQVDGGWQVGTEHGPISARSAVVALGPWSDHVFEPLGYRIPLRAKRGYHMHYRPTRAPLNVPVCDTEAGFVVAPMEGGRLRLTTGVEIALRGAPPTGVQLARAEPLARDAFGIGERLDPEPWLGMRPCTPDMRPVISAPRHRHLWFAFGHCHHGHARPASGRLLAEMITGAPTYIDPHPYRRALRLIRRRALRRARRPSQCFNLLSELSEITQSEMICVIGKKDNREIKKISKSAIYQCIFILVKCVMGSCSWRCGTSLQRMFRCYAECTGTRYHGANVTLHPRSVGHFRQMIAA